MTKRRYTYTVLRYVHDPVAAEFVNVGLVLFCPRMATAAPLLKAAMRKTAGRMNKMFPDLDRSAFTSAMRIIEGQLAGMTDTIIGDDLFPPEGDAATFARQVLPDDDTSLQWSPIGSGLTDGAERTFDRLYARFVARYDSPTAARRSDEDVWRPVRDKIAARVPGIELCPHLVTGQDDSIQFENAWKNGAWHVYEPISLDLANADEINKKAYRWLGQMTSLGQTPEALQANFIVGAPEAPELQEAYRHAIHVIGKPANVTVFEEGDVDLLVEVIEEEARRHEAQTVEVR